MQNLNVKATNSSAALTCTVKYFIQGSDDNKTWTTLCEKTGTRPANGTCQLENNSTFTLDKQTPFLYHRLVFYATDNNTTTINGTAVFVKDI